MELTADEQLARDHFETLVTDPSFRFKKSRKGHYINPALEKNWKCFLMGYRHAKDLRGNPSGDDVPPGGMQGLAGSSD